MEFPAKCQATWFSLQTDMFSLLRIIKAKPLPSKQPMAFSNKSLREGRVKCGSALPFRVESSF
eukprot:764133-Pelagomonas_calceolata.AAC.2